MAEQGNQKPLSKNLRSIGGGNSDDCRLQIYAPVGEDGADRLAIFNRSQIYCTVAGEEAGTSVIRFYGGMVIPVRLSLLELDDKLHNFDFRSGNLIDLAEVTKPAVLNDYDISWVGTKRSDGAIFAGISPDTHKPMYAAPADAPLSLSFNDAAKYAENLEVGGKKGFRVPSMNELKLLFQNRKCGALKDTFNQENSGSSWYWSSETSQYSSDQKRHLDLSKGNESYSPPHKPYSLRCVRD
ncbi:MAG: DUF1566 domain-containing protein [Proteobacteria bacterium]|nr:DUF1566 domain-containing protein [Pseudomonadota bacterium]